MRLCLRVPAEYSRYVEQRLRELHREVEDDVKQRAGDALFTHLPSLIMASEIDADRQGEECYVVVTDAVPVAAKVRLRRSA